MSIKQKQSLGIVVADIDFFFSHRFELAKKLSEKYQILVISDLRKADMSKLAKHSFIKFVQLKSRARINKFINIISTIRYIIGLAVALKLNKIDHIFFITLESSMIGAIASKYISVKKYYVISGAYVLKENKKIKLIASRIFSFFKSMNDKFIFQNNEDKFLFEKMLGQNNQSFVIKGNGVNLSSIKFEPIKNINKVKFLYAGSLFYTKGVIEYLDAAKTLKNLSVNADFYIAGQYIEKHPLSIKKALYKNIVESSTVKFLGAWDKKTFLENIYDYHVFVLPSYGEGMPLAAMEAMASGRALICTKAPGCNSCIVEGKNGYFCEVSSSDSLKESMQKIINSKDLMPVMGNYSRKLVEKDLCLDSIFKKYLEVIQTTK
jgi:glycosyltransferase involved in cell wall biosynthesis